jgi:hypothetical protein
MQAERVIAASVQVPNYPSGFCVTPDNRVSIMKERSTISYAVLRTILFEAINLPVPRIYSVLYA